MQSEPAKLHRADIVERQGKGFDRGGHASLFYQLRRERGKQ
jgi:hypothetical protein